jgi:hypothetical protein
MMLSKPFSVVLLITCTALLASASGDFSAGTVCKGALTSQNGYGCASLNDPEKSVCEASEQVKSGISCSTLNQPAHDICQGLEWADGDQPCIQWTPITDAFCVAKTIVNHNKHKQGCTQLSGSAEVICNALFAAKNANSCDSF